jgi:hypothetical protein
MTRTLAFILAAAAIVGCSSSETASFDGASQNAGRAPSESGDTSSAAPGSGGSTSSSGGEATDPTDPGTQPGSQQAGQLTAGVWDDNLNFEFFSKYAAGAEASLAGLPAFSAGERAAARDKFLQRAAKAQLDVAFLFDTTGSMGDELSYLQTEIDAIAESIATRFPSATARYSLVLYRDEGDAYVTRTFDFTTDLAGFQSNLSAQRAAGGGDYPEAVAEGLEQVNALDWRTEADVAKVAFWIADAPTHTHKASALKTAITTSVQNDIHLYPVAASGTDPRAEYSMRAAAQISGGRYVFLTDDSGIGGTHAEPHIPCYVVTRFDRALVRMVESEMTGSHVFAPAPEILRTVGSPVEGKCETKASGQVTLY